MNELRPSPASQPKAPTGITGLDDITGGGLPRGRTTLLVGGPGSGKTVLALQFLVNGARQFKEPGIFVSFEETSRRIVSNAESFGWKLGNLVRRRLFFMDAQPNPDLVQAGDFDLGGLCAGLAAKAREIGAKRVVFDALDIVLALLPDDAARTREIYRLHDWLLKHGLTAVITLKAGGDAGTVTSRQPFDVMQFMVDCVVILAHGVILGLSQRNLRVQKYRGSAFDENESPFLIGTSGVEVPITHIRAPVDRRVSSERVSSGVKRLDTMLGGGYFRGSSVLITGYSGTAKTTLSGTFAEAACRRGERTLFVSFDSDGAEVVRNLGSVGMRLGRYVKNGRLRLITARAITGSAETYLVRIKTLATEHRARCVIVDPLSTWSKSANDSFAQNNVAERLIDWSKSSGITLVCTRLLDEMSSAAEGASPLQASTLADTWIHLSYLVQAGERNRGLSIIKSRGMAHSNQVRELILSGAGVTLTDTYTADGEVLMGTMRWEKERTERLAHEAAQGAARLKRIRLAAEEADLAMKFKSLQAALTAKQLEIQAAARAAHGIAGEISAKRHSMRELRGADAPVATRK